MSKRVIVALVGITIFPSVLSFIIMLATLKIVSDDRKELLNSVDRRISTIVLATLSKVKEDISLISPSMTTSPILTEEKKDVEDKQVKIDGANLSTFEHHFYIDNTPFFVGDIIAPYGMAVQIGRDCVVFDDFNGGLTVLGKKLPEKKSEENTAIQENGVKSSERPAKGATV